MELYQKKKGWEGKKTPELFIQFIADDLASG